MDGISLLEASVFYSVLVSPLLTIVLLLFWTSSNINNTAKIQLLGIFILFYVGIFLNSSMFLIIGTTAAIILLVVWILAYKNYFLKGQLRVTLLIFVIQVAYYILFFELIGLENNLAILLLCIIPILSMLQLYPWTFGNKKTSKGRVFIIFVFVVQVIFLVLNIVLSLITT